MNMKAYNLHSFCLKQISKRCVPMLGGIDM